MFCITITFNNPLIIYNTAGQKYVVNSRFIIEKKNLLDFLKTIVVQNQLPITFVTALVCNKIGNKSEQKVILSLQVCLDILVKYQPVFLVYRL